MTLHITGHSDLLATIEAQRREIAELGTDARRYRFLRSAIGGDYFACIEDNGENGDRLKHEADLDAAIDAAIAGDKP